MVINGDLPSGKLLGSSWITSGQSLGVFHISTMCPPPVMFVDF